MDDGSLDVDMHDTHHDVPSFKLFTLHSISGFFMMFGLVGLACTDQFDLSYVHAFAIAAVAGVSVMVLIALIFRSALLFQGSGTVFTLNKTVGLVGTVYQRIPAHGQGKVSLVVNGISREVLAQSPDKKPIESFKIVTVIRVVDHEVVEVTELYKEQIYHD